ncbi:hypothetical protein FB45DRAFT_1130060 [Roridomyces roridus]|uniref:Uncharacterized protein n=1 Tax=Roridomyces roridus TaxID=1738132 RepID=A0AAD7FA52_9AGAR|nr:hypothetical protein FB45DRAFT_1130060 [Roridomyces roridus]
MPNYRSLVSHLLSTVWGNRPHPLLLAIMRQWESKIRSTTGRRLAIVLTRPGLDAVPVAPVVRFPSTAAHFTTPTSSLIDGFWSRGDGRRATVRARGIPVKTTAVPVTGTANSPRLVVRKTLAFEFYLCILWFWDSSLNVDTPHRITRNARNLRVFEAILGDAYWDPGITPFIGGLGESAVPTHAHPLLLTIMHRRESKI